MQCSLLLAQVTDPDLYKSGGRRQGILLLALAAMEAALRRIAEPLGVTDRLSLMTPADGDAQKAR